VLTTASLVKLIVGGFREEILQTASGNRDVVRIDLG